MGEAVFILYGIDLDDRPVLTALHGAGRLSHRPERLAGALCRAAPRLLARWNRSH
jgi:hypothetical protein